MYYLLQNGHSVTSVLHVHTSVLLYQCGQQQYMTSQSLIEESVIPSTTREAWSQKGSSPSCCCVTLSWPRNSTEIRQEPKPFMLFLWVHNDINCQDPRSVKTMAELKTQCLLTSSVNIDNNLNINFRIRIHSRSLLLLIFCPVLV